MTRAIFALLLLLTPLTLPCVAQEPLLAEAREVIVLSFRIKVSVPEGGKTRTMEIAPKVAVRNDQEAQIKVDSPDKTQLSIKVRPHLTGKEAVEIALTVNARLGGSDLERKARLVTLLGSPALIEYRDDRKGGETLTIEVTPTRRTEGQP